MSGRRAKAIRRTCRMLWDKVLSNEQRQLWGSFRRYYRTTKHRYVRGEL